MTETVETPDTSNTVIDRRPNRLNQAAAWVAIVAGVVFVVGSIFFTGFFLGRHSGHGGGIGRHHGGPGSYERLIPMPGMGPSGMMPPPGSGPQGPTSIPSPPPGR